MLEKFTADARQAVTQAREEARLLHHGFIGCEHLLLALSGQDGSPAAASLAAFGLDTGALRARVTELTGPGEGRLDPAALASLGIDLDVVRQAAEASFGPGALDRDRSRRGGRIAFTPPAKRTLELALRTAVKQRDKEISTAHLLLGLLGQGDNAALQVLSGAGVTPGALREELARHLPPAAA